jgi:hypothetical protein
MIMIECVNCPSLPGAANANAKNVPGGTANANAKSPNPSFVPATPLPPPVTLESPQVILPPKPAIATPKTHPLDFHEFSPKICVIGVGGAGGNAGIRSFAQLLAQLHTLKS